MKALTIRQPYASLVAVGAKTMETRSFRTSYRGPLLIHAGKCEPDLGMTVGAWTVCRGSSGWTMRDRPPGQAASENAYVPLPLGAVVASCRLVDCVPMVESPSTVRMEYEPHKGKPRLFVHRTVRADEELWLTNPQGGPPIDMSDQLPFGNYEPGNFAWILEDIKPTTERCPRCWGKGECDSYGYSEEYGHGWYRGTCPTCETSDGWRRRSAPRSRCAAAKDSGPRNPRTGRDPLRVVPERVGGRVTANCSSPTGGE